MAGKPTNSAVLELGLLDERTGRFDAAQLKALTGEVKPAGQEPAADAPIEEQINWLNGQIRLAKRKIFELGPNTLAQMEAAAGITSGSADEIASADAQLDAAKSELSEAARAAANAASEQERLLVSEQARLLQTKNIQARFRSQLARSKAEPDNILESALAWRREVEDLAVAKTGRDRQADALYADLVGELSKIRAQLQDALSTSEYVHVEGLDPRPLDPALPQDTAATGLLLQQKAALSREARRLRLTYADRLWAKRSALRDAMVLLNEERLTLIPLLSSGKRASVLGFGSEGVAQVQREIAEIYLELRFYLQSWRQILAEMASPFLHPTPGFVLAMLRLVFVAIAFSWWQRRGDAVLRRAQTDAENKRPRTLFSTLQASTLEYWRRVHRPLDWFILAIVIRWLLPEELNFTGMRFVWIILFWSLATILIVRLVDELARGRGRDDPRAKLRWNSLQLIAGSALAVGLLLNLTRASVGKGAIHNWVASLSWLLVPTILVLLANWWRGRIVALAAAEAGGSAILGWAARDPGGLPGLFSRLAAGGILLLKGIRSLIARRLRDLALVRELFEQRARAEAARQVAEDKASGRFHRVAPEILESLDPHRMPTHVRVGRERPGGVELPEIGPGALVLIIGERGLGKSAFLRDLAREAARQCDVIALSVDSRGLAGLLGDLADALADADGERPDAGNHQAIAAALSARDKPCLVTIDNIQRLTVPTIGGLSSIDELISLARATGDQCRWACTIGEEAWSYLRRARIDRVLFDSVIRLPHWSASELRALIERRTAQAKVHPDFSAMIDEGVFVLGEDLTAEERKKRGYYDRLTEYVNGNPAIALEYWRRSLFVDGADQTVVVRTFDKPAVARLSALPLPALFVLRAILQMDVANASAIQLTTDLPATVVTDALRSLERLGAVTVADGSYRIALRWWIEVVRLLLRQNLIVRDMK